MGQRRPRIWLTLLCSVERAGPALEVVVGEVDIYEADRAPRVITRAEREVLGVEPAEGVQDRPRATWAGGAVQVAADSMRRPPPVSGDETDGE